MPYKRRRSSYGKRSASRKKARIAARKRFYKRSARVIRQPRVVSSGQIVKLRYTDTVTMDAGVGTLAYDTWSATSLYDPYVGAGGHQPLGFDEWMNFYNHFQVLGAKMRAYAIAPQINPGSETYMIGQISASTAAPATTIDQAIEQKRSSYSFFTTSQGKAVAKVTVKYSPRRFFSLRNPRDEHDLRGDASSNPTENAYFQVMVGGFTGSQDPTACNVRVIIDYIALFTERKHLNQS